jgi:DNA-binding response OmpR family regulator
VARALDLAGYQWKCVTDESAALAASWGGAVVDAGDEPDRAMAFLRLIRRADLAVAPVMLLLRGSMLNELEARHELFDDFCVTPFHPLEFEARMRHVLSREGTADVDAETIVYDALVLNFETYQAAIAGHPLDLTYMEYELLKFLAQNPGRVFTRETLLSRVWGYEYYGGARTVDVHIRRLRAKLGEEHAGLISTVRSVGYRFGESRWA